MWKVTVCLVLLASILTFSVANENNESESNPVAAFEKLKGENCKYKMYICELLLTESAISTRPKPSKRI